MSKLRWPAKVGLVIGGYVLACLISGGSMYVYEFMTPFAAAQASGGMGGFGDLVLFAGLLGCLGLFPTALAGYFVVRKLLGRQRLAAANENDERLAR